MAKSVKFTFRKTKVCFPVFENYYVWIVETNDFERAIQNMRLDVVGRKRTRMVATTFNADDGSHSIIFFHPKPPAAYIAHESWHVIRNMFAKHGATLEDEIVAYHLDYLVGKADEFLRRKDG